MGLNAPKSLSYVGRLWRAAWDVAGAACCAVADADAFQGFPFEALPYVDFSAKAFCPRPVQRENQGGIACGTRTVSLAPQESSRTGSKPSVIRFASTGFPPSSKLKSPVLRPWPFQTQEQAHTFLDMPLCGDQPFLRPVN